MEAALQELLKADDLDNNRLANRLLKLLHQDGEAFRQLAHIWAIELYQRDPIYFETFLLNYLPKQDEVTDQLLQRAEADGNDTLFQRLYNRVATRERWNREVKALTQSEPDYERLLAALKRRGVGHYQRWAAPTDSTAIALWERGIRSLLQDMIGRSSGDFKKLRKIVRQEEPDSPLDFYLFREFATPEEWRATLRERLTKQPQDIDSLLRMLQLRHHTQLLDDELRFALIEGYGEAVLPYLKKYDEWFFQKMVETIMNLDIGPEDRFSQLALVIRTNSALSEEGATSVIQKIYEFDPELLRKLLYNLYGKSYQAALRNMISRIQNDRHVRLFVEVFSKLSTTNAEVNAAALYLINAPISDSELRSLLKKLYQRQQLNEAIARSLYKRSPDQFRTFISDRIGYRAYFGGGSDNFDSLLEDIKQNGDDDLYWQLFRKLPKPDAAWQREMRTLLETDVPPENIADELEKRHPHKTTEVDSEVLSKFLEKYGESVLSYFERHLNWVTRPRLESLLALDIPRADLLQELEAIARRQPRQFSEMADLWAPALYERGPEFFQSFFLRYLNWQNEYLVKSLLPKMQEDGYDDLFQQLYRVTIRPNEWGREMHELALSEESDEDVLFALEQRDVRRFALDDDTAAHLYERNRDLFRDFILAHAPRLSGDLLKMAQQHGDTELLARIIEHDPSQEAFQARVDSLLEQDLSGEGMLAELQQINLHRYWYANDLRLILDVVERYGDEVLPYLVDNASTLVRYKVSTQEVLDLTQKYGTPAQYWTVFFSVKDNQQWNAALRDLLGDNLTPAEFKMRLDLMSPPPHTIGSWRRWALHTDLALAIYENYGCKPFLEQYLVHPTTALFEVALERDDEDFLDFLSVDTIRVTMESWLRQGIDAKELEALTPVILTRFDHLYKQSPQSYIDHASRILSRIQPFTLDQRKMRKLEQYPILHYLFSRHTDLWRQSSEGIRELLESPNIFIQIAALDMLDHDDAAPRVAENVMLLRAMLLNRARKNTKRKVLLILEHAARQSDAAASDILPVLESVMSFRGRRAIMEDVLVSFVRLRQELEGA